MGNLLLFLALFCVCLFGAFVSILLGNEMLAFLLIVIGYVCLGGFIHQGYKDITS